MTRARSAYLLRVALLTLLGLWLRLAGNMRLPLFLDEAMHLDWTHAVLRGDRYIGLLNNKLLYPILLAPFNLTGPEAPWLSRALSALTGAVSLAAAVALGRRFGSRRAGLVAGLIYALLPFAVFHERQALVDPLMTAFTGIALVAMVRLTRRPGPVPMLVLGLSLAGAYLTKVAAFPYLVLPVMAVILLGAPRARLRALLWTAVGVGLAAAIIAVVYQQAAAEGVVPAPIYRLTPQNLALGSGGLLDLVRLRADLVSYAQILNLYVTVPFLLAVLAAVVGDVTSERERLGALLFLAIPAWLFGLVPLIASRPAGGLAPRYLLASVIPLAVMAALGFDFFLNLLHQRVHAPLSRRFGMLLVLAALVPALWFDGALIAAPLRVPLPDIDRVQYQAGDPSGIGWAEAAQALLAAHATSPTRPIHLLGEGSWIQAAMYLGPRISTYGALRPTDPAQRGAVAEWLASGDPVFVVFQGEPSAEEVLPHGAHLDWVGAYYHPSGDVVLYRVAAASDPLASLVYDRLGPRWDQLPDSYAALAQALAAEGAPAPLIVFPGRPAAQLAAQTDRPAIPLALPHWPPVPEDVRAALSQAALNLPTTLFDAVLIDPAGSDPARVVQHGLQQQYFFVRQDWFGPLLRLRYVTGPLDPSLQPTGIEYEGPIMLAESALLDPQVHPGEFVRIVLRWQSPVPIRDSYSIFVHLVESSSGTLAAQADGIPGAGLYPMPTWQPNTPVTERIAIRIPPEASPGVYEVRVGIYLPSAGLRLGVRSAPEAGPGYTILARVDVLAP